MSEIVLDADDMVGLLRQVVEGREEYIYPTDDACEYVWLVRGEWVPGCIIGHTLVAAGLEPRALADMHQGQQICTGEVQEYLADECDLRMTDPAVEIALAAQAAQDVRRPWGEALEWAERKAVALTREVKA